jgi:hypothetical protein
MNKPTYEELQAKRDALAAQVEVLRASMSDAVKMHKAEVFTKSMWETAFDEFEMLLEQTPSACLAQVLADAFKSGFSKAKAVYGCELGHCATDLNEWADQYAERILQEVV